MTAPEAIVVGSGLIGAAVALNLAQHGCATWIVDQSCKAHGTASQAAGAMLGAFGEITADRTDELDEQELRFRVRAADLYPGWVANVSEASGRCVAIRFGTFVIVNAAGASDRQNLQAMAAALDAFGQTYERVDPADIPNLKPGRQFMSYDALFLPNEGFVDTSILLDALDVALQRRSEVTRLEDTVLSLAQVEGRVTGVHTAHNGTLHADHVVLCAGAGTQEILDRTPELSLDLPRLLFGKGASLVVRSETQHDFVIRTPNRDFACGTHVVPREGGALYVGATNRIYSRLGPDGGVTMDEAHYLLDSAIHEICTGLGAARIESLSYGSRPVTADRYPLVGKTKADGLFLATGTYRNGVLMAPLIAAIVVDEMVGKPASHDNPFGCLDRAWTGERVAAACARAIDDGARDFARFLQEPGGRLPYNHTQELEDLVRVLARSTLLGDHTFDAAHEQMRQVLEQFPIAEVFPEIFYRYHFMARASAAESP